MSLASEATVGERIAYHRKRLGLTQAVLSVLLGRSEEWLSQIERGSRSVERLTTIVDVAKVLRMEPVLLLPPPFFAKPRMAGDAGTIGTASEWVPAIRAVMMRRPREADQEEPVHVGALARTVARAFRYSQSERWSDLGPVLPGLVSDAHHAVAVREDPQTLRLLSGSRSTSGVPAARS